MQCTYNIFYSTSLRTVYFSGLSLYPVSTLTKFSYSVMCIKFVYACMWVGCVSWWMDE